MLPQYHDARHEVRDTVIEMVENLANTNKLAFEAMKSNSVEGLENARKGLKEMQDITEKIDNNIVLIFAKFTPGARDLREMVSYLKVTSELNRIQSNVNSYLKNMQSVLIEDNRDMSEFIHDSLRINQCTLKAFDYSIEMLKTFEDDDKIKKLASKINIEFSKTEDIYSILEKEMVQKMSDADSHAGEYFNLLKYFRKNMKIIDRLENIAQRVIFARMGGKL
ncbi:MAG: Phosphate transport system regulatory protein PhoU [uncultured Sulfurovum sp.]|uniref:Phosphate transport system regulatory protein PhoU n=1 Tax=uncultured Sulfurovum sp. TaxID=269237 RepID=A0A6S6TRS9_9BACT|nr:MAG: Phosphate transport system regulatory protein PhoU [uncultured Sulfurovum sp.]